MTPLGSDFLPPREKLLSPLRAAMLAVVEGFTSSKTACLAAIIVGLFCASRAHPAIAAPRFTGLYQTYGGFSNSLSSSALAEMTTTGPIGTPINLPVSLSDVTIDPGGSGYYGEIAQSVYRIDPATLQATEMNVGLPQYLGWPVGVAFDTTRNRLILATLEGEGFLFAYFPQLQTWTYVNSLNNVDLQSIVYRPADDTLYGLPNLGGYGIVNTLYKYAPDGRFLGTIPLQYALGNAQTYGDGGYQLLLTDDDQLAVLTPPVAGSQRLYLIDPATGAISYDAVFPAPEPASASLLTLGALCTLLQRPCRARRGMNRRHGHVLMASVPA